MKKNLTVLLAALLLFLLSFNVNAQVNVSAQGQPAANHQIKKGMIKVTILYPNAEGKTFDMAYYTQKHFPMLRSVFGDALKATAIDKGLASGTPGAPVPFLAIGYLYFDNVAAFQDGMKVNAAKIRGDIPNYTNITPIVLVSEVVE